MNIDNEIEIERLRNEVRTLRLSVGELRSALDKDYNEAASWLQRKVHAQAKALSVLGERVVNQRFTLRNIERLGRGLTPEELESARVLEGITVPEAVLV
jgi:hypothetical protein